MSPEACALWYRMCPYFWIAGIKLGFRSYGPLTSCGLTLGLGLPCSPVTSCLEELRGSELGKGGILDICWLGPAILGAHLLLLGSSVLSSSLG